MLLPSRPAPLCLIAATTLLLVVAALLTAHAQDRLPTLHHLLHSPQSTTSALFTPGIITLSPKTWQTYTAPPTVFRPTFPLSSLRNHRYHFSGDSIQGVAHIDFCAAIGADYQEVSLPASQDGKLVAQKIPYCELPKYNFSAVHLHWYGLRDFQDDGARKDVDRGFLMGHPNFEFRDGIEAPSLWRFESLISQAHSRTVNPDPRFGPATVVFTSTGLWDTAYLQQDLATSSPPSSSADLPDDWATAYTRRLNTLLDVCFSLNAGAVRKVVFLSFHDPAVWERDKSWGLNGLSDEVKGRVQVSAHDERRIRGFRNLQIREVGKRKAVEVWPYHEWVRAAPPGDRRMRDLIHPAAWVNEFLVSVMVVKGAEW